MGFQGLKFKRPRSGSSAAPFWNPEARLALPCQKKKKTATQMLKTIGFMYICDDTNEGKIY